MESFYQSSRYAQLSCIFVVALLDGVANHAMVELEDVQLVTYLAEKKPTGQVFFRKGKLSLSSSCQEPNQYRVPCIHSLVLLWLLF